MSCGMYTSVQLALTLLHHLERLDVPFSGVLGEFCAFSSVRRVLTFLLTFPAICISFAMECVSVCTFDISAKFLQLSGSCGCCHAASTGKSGGFSLFQGMLTISGAFADLLVSISTLGMSASPFDVSAWVLALSASSTLRFGPPTPRYMLRPSP